MPLNRHLTNQTKYIVTAVFNGTSLKMHVPGNSVDSVMLKLRRDRLARAAACYLFIMRKTGKLVDTRYN